MAGVSHFHFSRLYLQFIEHFPPEFVGFKDFDMRDPPVEPVFDRLDARCDKVELKRSVGEDAGLLGGVPDFSLYVRPDLLTESRDNAHQLSIQVASEAFRNLVSHVVCKDPRNEIPIQKLPGPDSVEGEGTPAIPKAAVAPQVPEASEVKNR